MEDLSCGFVISIAEPRLLFTKKKKGPIPTLNFDVLMAHLQLFLNLLLL